MILAVLNQKGGTGKTTLSVHIAYELGSQGKKVLLVDSDPQGSSIDWLSMRGKEAPFNVVALSKAVLHTEVPKLAVDYDITIIDGAPRTNELTRSAILSADVILIPVSPSPLDVWATHEVVNLIKEASSFRPNTKVFFLINRKIGNTNITVATREALNSYEYPLLESAITQRVGFAEAFATGKTVQETLPNGTAREEIKRMVEELAL